jgi:uncharacterized membrane protein YagU involved in acid resistance
MSKQSVEVNKPDRLFWYGIGSGLVAGIIFAMAEMMMNLFIGKPFFGPLKLIGSMVLGVQALQPSYPFATALIVGLVVHMMMSMIFGLVFIYLLAAFRQVRANIGLKLAYGLVYGAALWVINFLILAPLFFPQFTSVDQFWNGFFAHTFFFGMMIGIIIALVKPHRDINEVKDASGHRSRTVMQL